MEFFKWEIIYQRGFSIGSILLAFRATCVRATFDDSPCLCRIFSNVSMPHPTHPTHGCNKLMTDDSQCLCRSSRTSACPTPPHPSHGCNKLMTDDSQCLCKSSRTSACPTPPTPVMAATSLWLMTPRVRAGSSRTSACPTPPTPLMAATSLWLMTPSVCAGLLERQHAPPHPTPPQSWLQQAYDWWLPVFVQDILERQHAPPHPPHSWLQQAYDWWLPVFVQVFSNVSMPHPTPVMAATSLWLMTPSVCASLLERQHAPPHPTPPQSWLQQAYDWWLPVFVQVFLNVSMPQLIGAGSHFTLHPISR